MKWLSFFKQVIYFKYETMYLYLNPYILGFTIVC